MKEWKVILATLVLFGTGVVTGGLLVHLTSVSSVKPLRGKAMLPPNMLTKDFKDLRGPVHEQRFEYIRRLTQQLELAPEQAGKIEKILQSSQQRTKSVWDTIQPKLNEEVRKTREQIHEVLTPEQQKKYDEINKQQRTRKDGRPETSNKSSKRPKLTGTAPQPDPQAPSPPTPDGQK